MTSDIGPANSRLAMFTVDCADPREQAEFWSRLLGGQVVHNEDEYAMVAVGDGPALGFGRVDGFTPPPWPDTDGRKQFHLDIAADDVTAAEVACRGLGATVPEFQPGGDRWRVLLDPAGHPFCLTDAAAWS